jgi:putative transposase
MSRPLRIEYPGAWYHVMNRGRRKENIFLSRHDYETFIKILQETSAAWNLKVSAYCLMPNHYHLLVQTPDGNISRCMRHINGVYTQRFNRHHGIDGQLFRGRYKAVLVDADSYLLEVLRYIHRNPLQAGIADTLHDFAWSSHHGYLSSAKKWKWLQKDTLLAMLSPIQSRRRSAYLNFVSAGAPAEIEQFYALKNLPSLLGADAFKEWVREKFDQIKFHREIPESRELSPAPEKIINAVCTYFKTDKLRLLTSRRGTENLPRDIAIYLVRRRCRETLATVGRHFAIHNYSTVSSAIERIEARKINDQSLQNHLKKLEIMLAKSQKQT